ncbi:hypothetical protein K438DRAFT_2123002 [Mycena galopus ATCC 62051]|nr:hypothetical protein K438DRAFT_2123002 [Mycena galopus ATCC 62051]
MLLPPHILSTRIDVADGAASQSCDDSSNCRAFFGIVWGCLTTIFACTWVSVHPNLPIPRQNWFRLFHRRLGMMLIAVIAPEIMVFFAARQFFFAREFSKKFGVSLTHGFFFAMGGFVARGSQHPIATLKQLEEPLRGPQYITDIQATEVAHIMDRSKGDALSKGVALLQSSWFITQCIARASHQLPLTKLEVATLAFAVVNIFTWVLWWNKPLDVQCPISIGPVEARVTNSKISKTAWSVGGIIRSIAGAVYGSDEYDPTASNAVPVMWCPPVSQANHAFRLEATVAIIFGLIHCAAWNTRFPSTAEKWLWWLCALIITILPALMGVIQILVEEVTMSPVPRSPLLNGLFGGSLMTYIISRLVLIVLPFTTLRGLPQAAFLQISWTTDIPHF